MSEPMPMLLDAADQVLLSQRLMARVERRPSKRITEDEVRAEIRAAAEELVAEGGFVFQDGVLIRWPPLLDGEEQP